MTSRHNSEHHYQLLNFTNRSMKANLVLETIDQTYHFFWGVYRGGSGFLPGRSQVDFLCDNNSLSSENVSSYSLVGGFNPSEHISQLLGTYWNYYSQCMGEQMFQTTTTFFHCSRIVQEL